jgi:hypothetical protein
MCLSLWASAFRLLALKLFEESLQFFRDRLGDNILEHSLELAPDMLLQLHGPCRASPSLGGTLWIWRLRLALSHMAFSNIVPGSWGAFYATHAILASSQ